MVSPPIRLDVIAFRVPDDNVTADTVQPANRLGAPQTRDRIANDERDELCFSLRTGQSATADRSAIFIFGSDRSLTGPIVLGFAVIGFVVVLVLLCDALREIALGLVAHMVPLVMPDRTPMAVKYGKWAVVTGSTDGIGKEYAKELAQRGLNIVLISRSIDKLNKIASEIKKEFNVEVKVIQADFSKGQTIFNHIAKELEGIEIGILVNNVGMQYMYPMYITEVPESTVWDLINVNVGATTHMTKLVLPGMQKRKRGAIVNVSSSAELQPLPLLAIYAATKSYIKSFTEALRIEYEEDNILVQHLFPLFINTKMNAFSYKLQETSLFVPDAKTYATNAVNTLGLVNHSTGYWAHGIQHFFLRLPPIWIRSLVGEFMTHSFRSDYFSKKGLKAA
ncbi:NAD(P)-binding domain,Short-chain dehydrogenase/reductase, conserved site,Short-chain [Cinara cedri]|uniref:NAD(P)-binding domain,Short-chain dehydrogenase/reductase, conserved site,Short-chain n=1 Tax=Cinara cedri TaxID=506608 RepID=A0A5E4NMW1_9HEMI|nr:NAD(P)-binding domain,Short-chain dehydrogenase/reductase, conserved site,Short-chain [Cinara cedri]